VISSKLKPILSKYISSKKNYFLDGRQIHEVVGVAQKTLHSVKSQKLKGFSIKIDSSKSYDWVNLIYIWLLLTHFGFYT